MSYAFDKAIAALQNMTPQDEKLPGEARRAAAIDKVQAFLLGGPDPFVKHLCCDCGLLPAAGGNWRGDLCHQCQADSVGDCDETDSDAGRGAGI